MDTTQKKKYIQPVMRVLEFRVEEGYQSSAAMILQRTIDEQIFFESQDNRNQVSHFQDASNWNNFDWNN